MPQSDAVRVVIFGGSACVPGEPSWDVAEQLGMAFAGQGWTVVNGGYGGTMLACSRGAAACGGKVIGVACRQFKSAPNEFISDPVWTDDLFARLRGLIELGNAYVALPGSTGTLAELAMVWELVNKGIIPPRPILCYGEFWRPVIEVFGDGDGRHIVALDRPDRRGQLIQIVHTPEETVSTLLTLLARLPGG